MLLQLCRPLESTEAPEAVREVWVMVDEYMLTEAEVSFIKLLETLDRTIQHNSSAVASNQPAHCQHVSELALADTHGISLVAEEDSSRKRSTDAVSSSCSSSSSSASVLEETFGTHQSDTLVNARSTELVFHPQNDNVTAFSFYEQEGCRHAAPPSQPQVKAECQGLGGRCQDPSTKPSKSIFERSSISQAHWPLPLHRSASSHETVPLHKHSSPSDVPKDNPSSKGDSGVKQASCDATEAAVANSTGEGASRRDSDQQGRAAACTLLCNPRATLQDRDTPGLDTSMYSASEPCDDHREAGISNMQMLIIKAQELQVSVIGAVKLVLFSECVVGC